MDIGFDTLKKLLADAVLTPVVALLLAESGYTPVTPRGWIEKPYPEVVLLSMAVGNREGRPDPGMLEAMGGCTLLRTDRNRWIELTTDRE